MISATSDGVKVSITDPVDCSSFVVTYELANASDSDNFQPLDDENFTDKITVNKPGDSFILRRMVDGKKMGATALAQL